MPKNHHIQNIMKKGPKARLTPLENAQKSSYPKYYEKGNKGKTKPFGKCPKFIISTILSNRLQKQG